MAITPGATGQVRLCGQQSGCYVAQAAVEGSGTYYLVLWRGRAPKQSIMTPAVNAAMLWDKYFVEPFHATFHVTALYAAAVRA